jgi:NhaC family Na+:H+ antiporter
MRKQIPPLNLSLCVIGISMAIIIIGTLFFRLKTEMLLCTAAMIAGIAAWRLGYTWDELDNAISQRMEKTISVLLLIWCVGMVISTFMYSGSIPMIIYYGLKLINPSLVVISAFFVCIIFSTCTGSAWSAAGTAGVAFMGVAQGLGVSLPLTAGAVISGSIFGDKLSPLSETTVLAPLCADSNIYDHIQSMLWTTVPPTIIASVVYFIAGREYVVSESAGIPESTLNILASLDSMFQWNILLIIPFIIVIVGSVTKKPPVPTLFFASISALGLGVFYQGFSLADGFKSAVSGFQTTMAYSGNIAPEVKKILDGGGMVSMNDVVLVVFCGYAFAAILSKAGFLDVALKPAIVKVKTPSLLVIATLLMVFLILLTTGSAYIAFVLVPEMFRRKYIELGVAPMILSRSLEDIGVVMGALIPWSLGGMFYVATLGVPIYGEQGFAIWTILAYLGPVVSVFYAVTGISIRKLNHQEKAIALKQLDEAEEAI